MSEHKNADGQDVEPVLWAHESQLLNQITPEQKATWAKIITEAFSRPLYTHPAPSQEGHAAGPACSAPNEALIEEISQDARYTFAKNLSFSGAVKWAIREYIRRSAGKEKG